MSSLFSIQCTTCNAKISVKSEILIGQILACPRCGGMVLVERPKPAEEEIVEVNEVLVDPTPSPQSLQENPPQQDDLSANIKFFPNPMTSITDSGLLNVSKPVEISLNNPNPLQNLSNFSATNDSIVLGGGVTKTEIRRRTIMLIVLVVLLVMLFLTTGLLFVQKLMVDKKQIDNTPEPPIEIVDEEQNIKQTIPPIDPQPNPPTQIDEPTPPINVTKNEDPPTPQEPTTNNNNIDYIPLPTVKKTNTPNNDTNDPLTDTHLPNNIIAPNSIEKYVQDLTNKTTDQPINKINTATNIKRIDIPLRLQQPILNFRYENVALVKVIRTISDLTDIPFTFDIDEMRAFGIKIDTAITGTFETNNVGAILEKILTPLNLVTIAENEQLTITVLSDKRNELVEETIDVSDIVKGTAKGEDQLVLMRLVEIIERFIDPVGFGNIIANNEQNNIRNDNKNDNKKITPQMRVVGESIFICSTRCCVDGVIRLLEQIRVLRGLPQKTEIVEENLAPEVFGWDKIDTPITLNYYQETQLSTIFDQIEKTFGILVIIDHKNLHKENLSYNQLHGKLRANNITLHEALDQLCSSIDGVPITYRIVGGNIIELTTNHIAKQPNKMSVEIHRYKTTENNETPEQIIESITTIIDPASWKNFTKLKNNTNENNVGNVNIDLDKLPFDKGDIVIDRPSSCLIIRQTQPTQRQIRTWLKQQ
ncbi:MAG: hypothetical protein LBH59_09200 [Planctomycetaceae bacterium]|jgi:DNA-directed RNA polymerase subunit RPC12/RpoP|nr:hypothetical protein [Planctomycetaceae bacterium]